MDIRLSAGRCDFSHARGAGAGHPNWVGHPACGQPHYGVVSAAQIMYRVPMIRLFRHAPSEADPTFFLNTDMWDMYFNELMQLYYVVL